LDNKGEVGVIREGREKHLITRPVI